MQTLEIETLGLPAEPGWLRSSSALPAKASAETGLTRGKRSIQRPEEMLTIVKEKTWDLEPGMENNIIIPKLAGQCKLTT